MRLIKSLRLSLLSIGLAGSLASVAVLSEALLSFHALGDSSQRAMVAKDVVADILPPPMYLVEMRLVLSQAVEQTLPRERALQEFTRLRNEYQARVDHWTANPPYGLEKHLLGEQHAAAQAFIVVAQEVLDKLASADAVGVQDLKRADDLYSKHRAGVDSTVVVATTLADDSMKRFFASRTNGIWMMSAVTLLLLLVTWGMYLWARHSILVPLRACADQANLVSCGDLSARIECNRHDEIGSLQQALSDMTAHLCRMVGSVRDGVNGISIAAHEIARGNGALSERTEQQASNLRQTAVSLNEMATAIRAGVDHSMRANELATGASKVTSNGGQAVVHMMTTMDEIRDSSDMISSIISVIDGIAFQTNILALNAAVEAARAGEQGRGFAVVASEVRSLATRSAEAAKEIKRLIGDSADKVGAGHQLATQAGQTMEHVADQVREMTLLIEKISSVGAKQNSGMNEISQAMSQLDMSTQQNASLVEKTSAASEALIRQAGLLATAVAAFRFK